MPIIWDIGLSIVAGFAFSSLKPMIKNARGKDVNENYFLVLGLLFNQVVIVLVSVFAWVVIDPNWLVLYWMNPADIGTAVHFIYLLFPFFFIGAYELNAMLYKRNLGRYAMLAVASIWVIFTLVIWPDFTTLFKGDDIAVHGIDYPPQALWNVTQFPTGNALWFLPMNIGTFFLFFSFIVIALLIVLEGMAIVIALTNFLSKKPHKEGA
jgi:hypothetical protein